MTNPLNLLNSLPGLLIFAVGTKEFCMDVKYVQTVINLAGNENLIQKANRASGIYGRFTHAHAEYLIIDTAKFFNASPVKPKEKKIILCTIFGKRIGIIVDLMVEFLSLDALFIEKNVDFNVYQEDKYIEWYLEYQGRKILYPNYEKIAKELSSSGLLQSLLMVSSFYLVLSCLLF